jgi:2'-5' RNA ligase
LASSYAVELTFDPIGEATVRVLRSALHAAGIPPSPRLLDARPHISLAVLEIDDAEALLAETAAFAVEIPPLSLDIAAVAGFAGDGGVLFLAPAPTEALLRWQRSLVERIAALPAEPEVWLHYRPDRWTPHCTLEVDVAVELLPAAFAAVRSALTPFEVTLERLRLVAFPPLNTLGSFELATAP